MVTLENFLLFCGVKPVRDVFLEFSEHLLSFGGMKTYNDRFFNMFWKICFQMVRRHVDFVILQCISEDAGAFGRFQIALD